jgi:hypothetical protein
VCRSIAPTVGPLTGGIKRFLNSFLGEKAVLAV